MSQGFEAELKHLGELEGLNSSSGQSKQRALLGLFGLRDDEDWGRWAGANPGLVFWVIGDRIEATVGNRASLRLHLRSIK